MPKDAKKRGKVVIGTAQGDIHDIGKSMVVSFLQANGFEVYDIGRDVEMQKFIHKAQEVDADIIGMSALLTTTMSGQKTLIQELKKAGLRDRFKVMVGGAPVTQRWADRIGADAYGVDAADAAKKAMKLLSGGRYDDEAYISKTSIIPCLGEGGFPLFSTYEAFLSVAHTGFCSLKWFHKVG